MSYGGHPYGGVAYAGSDVADIPADTETTLAVEVSFTTGALAEPAWVDITPDVRSWSTTRGRQRELERMQPGRATIVLGNLSRQYDSINTAGPWYGNLKPMKRIRIRETFSGVTYPVFDGYVDRWQLDYPGANKDATATVTATDGFKTLARTALARSVYTEAVRDAAPLVWWRLDDTKEVFAGGLNAVNAGSAGTSHDGVALSAPVFGDQGLVVKDPGTCMRGFDDESSAGTNIVGLKVSNATLNLLSLSAFSVEVWARTTILGSAVAAVAWGVSRGADVTGHCAAGYVDDGSGTLNNFQFVISNSTFANVYGVQTPNGSAVPGKIYHVVAVMEASGVMTIYLNGAPHQVAVPGTSGTTRPASVPTNGDFVMGASTRDSGTRSSQNWVGNLDELQVYDRALTATEVAAHYTAGTTPWNADLPGARIGRVLDLAGWPAARRELDAGITTFQSAELPDTALEHAQKAADTEYTSLLFMARDGNVRFIGRTAVFAREPYPIAFGPAASEVGYRNLVPDDGDAEIRNRAIVSRLNGATQITEDTASIAEFGPSDYVADGLLSNSETESKNHANFVVDEYGVQRRRIVSLDLGDSIVGAEAIQLPAMLAAELGNAITVRHEPPGGGDPYEAVCAIEGIEHAGTPKGPRTTRLILSPEFAIRALEDEDVATLEFVPKTSTDQTGITTITDLTGLSATVTVGTNRIIRVTGYVIVQQSTNAAVVELHVRESSTTLERSVDTLTAGQFLTAHTEAIIEAPSAGSHTYKLSLVSSAASVGTVYSATGPAFILVEDIGPA